MNIIGDTGHPFYRPLGRRIAIVVATAIWAAIETFYAGSALWSVIALATFLYSAWAFLITYKPPSES
jgi:hypothetical protein